MRNTQTKMSDFLATTSAISLRMCYYTHIAFYCFSNIAVLHVLIFMSRLFLIVVNHKTQVMGKHCFPQEQEFCPFWSDLSPWRKHIYRAPPAWTLLTKYPSKCEWVAAFFVSINTALLSRAMEVEFHARKSNCKKLRYSKKRAIHRPFTWAGCTGDNNSDCGPTLLLFEINQWRTNK